MKFQRESELYVFDISKTGYAENVLLATLQGIVAANTRDRIWLSKSDNKQLLEYIVSRYALNITAVSQISCLLSIFSEWIKGIILYDESDNFSVNTATALCGEYHAVAVSKKLLNESILSDLPVIMDCSGKNQKWLLNQDKKYKFDKRTFVEINPQLSCVLRDYAVMNNYLTFFDGGDSQFRKDLLMSAEDDATVLGWSKSEQGELGFIGQGSECGVCCCANDWSVNLSVLSSLPSEKFTQKFKDTETAENNVHYLTIVMSDGDNEQWFVNQGFENEKWYLNKYNGLFHMGYSFPPGLTERAPAVLKKIYDNATDKTEFIIGPSGCGYMYPSMYPITALSSFTNRLNDYMEATDVGELLVMDENGFENMAVWNEYTKQNRLNGIFYLEYSLHTKESGKLLFSNGKPVFACTDMLWQGLEDEANVIKNINSRPTDKYNKNSYTMLYIHAWSKTMDNVYEVVKHLNSNVKIVSAKRFFEEISKNLYKGKDGII